MLDRFNRRVLVPAVCICVGCMTLATTSRVAAGQALTPAEAHRQMMNDASDAQEDFRFAVSDKNPKAAVEALGKLETFMGQTVEYWSARKAADGVKLAAAAKTAATQALGAAKTGNMAAAGEAFDKMGASCNACHDLHLEKR